MNRSIYLALDFPTWQEAERFIDQNGLYGVPVKVGMELFYREGPDLIDKLKQQQHAIFLDLKLHDIPTTVKRTMTCIAQLGVDMVNVHALGGGDMIQQAKEGLLAGSRAHHAPDLIAVTMLTSMDKKIMNHDLKIQGDIRDHVVHLADCARKNGADGVVCSVHEAKKIKEVCTSTFLTVTPGIRLPDSEGNDQKRISDPASARENGSDRLVVGRAVTNAENPKAAYEQVQREWRHDIKS